MPIEVPGKRWGKRMQRSRVFGHGNHGRKNVFADLLITPLVDMFVIIVLFLIANFSASGEILSMTRDIQLPTASHVKELESYPVIQISKDKIVVDGSPLPGTVQDLLREDYNNIPPLEEKLRELKKTYEVMHGAAGDTKAFSGDVNIQADKDAQFKIVKRVMFSCSTAGYGNINFAVLNGGGPKPGETTAAAVP